MPPFRDENGCVEGCPVRVMDEQSGESKSPKTYKRNANGFNVNSYGSGMGEAAGKESVNFGDSGGASRFFPCFYPDDIPEQRKGNMSSVVLEGDCVEVMRGMEENSVDAVVCDPPYGLEFMGKEWDRLTSETKGRKDFKPSAQHIDKEWNGYNSQVKPGAPKKNPRCRKCGGYKFAPVVSQCKCDLSDWDTRTAEYARTAQAWHEAWAREAFRVLKPGGHMLAFGGTRTVHRLTCAIEDAGFEIRDCINWVYGSGFPKSLNVGKAIDKMAGAEREVVGSRVGEPGYSLASDKGKLIQRNASSWDDPEKECAITAPATEAAKQWEGFGTALKPSHEPIVVARKPLSESSVARNVLEHGTGAINVDGCRVGATVETWPKSRSYPLRSTGNAGVSYGSVQMPTEATQEAPAGRWPPNLLLTHDAACERVEDFECVEGCPVRVMDEQSGQSKSRQGKERGATPSAFVAPGAKTGPWNEHNDSGGAPRFFPRFETDEDFAGFKYSAKASRRERNAGFNSIEIISVKYQTWGNGVQKVKLRVDTASSRPKVIAGFGIQGNSVSEWNTLLFGNDTTAPSLKTSKSTTLTAKSSTTASKTLQWLTRSLTSEFTADANLETVNGGSPAASAVKSSPFLSITSVKPASLPGASDAALRTRLLIRSEGAGSVDHPTIKPLALMRWLVRLVTPPEGTVLDPFAGSGTTGCAAVQEGFNFIGIEREAEYAEIARRRIEYWSQPEEVRAKEGKAPAKKRTTYGFKTTRKIPRCPEHDQSHDSGTTLYRCGCPFIYENTESARPDQEQNGHQAVSKPIGKAQTGQEHESHNHLESSTLF